MQKHIVTCVQCGRQFDANKGAHYDAKSRRYMCKSCVRKHNQAVRTHNATVREKTTGMKQSTGAMIAKIAIGVIVIISCTAQSPWNIGTFLVGLVIGCALIAWSIVPKIKAQKAQQAEAAAAEAEKKECPKCGAVSSGDVCEYCGSALK